MQFTTSELTSTFCALYSTLLSSVKLIPLPYQYSKKLVEHKCEACLSVSEENK